jgi:hypothetical protein
MRTLLAVAAVVWCGVASAQEVVVSPPTQDWITKVVRSDFERAVLDAQKAYNEAVQRAYADHKARIEKLATSATKAGNVERAIALKQEEQYWEKRGLPYGSPTLPALKRYNVKWADGTVSVFRIEGAVGAAWDVKREGWFPVKFRDGGLWWYRDPVPHKIEVSGSGIKILHPKGSGFGTEILDK